MVWGLAPERRDRVQYIRDQIMNYDNSAHLKEFGIRVDLKMKPIEARVLPMPGECLGNIDCSIDSPFSFHSSRAFPFFSGYSHGSRTSHGKRSQIHRGFAESSRGGIILE